MSTPTSGISVAETMAWLAAALFAKYNHAKTTAPSVDYGKPKWQLKNLILISKFIITKLSYTRQNQIEICNHVNPSLIIKTIN